jgi:hypothetical protein
VLWIVLRQICGDQYVGVVSSVCNRVSKLTICHHQEKFVRVSGAITSPKLNLYNKDGLSLLTAATAVEGKMSFLHDF